ncbi:MAG: metal-dependent transcriptional regulator [Opitutaceae bacterium]|jgi:DtxR family Mn-dependent transcriptional regulator
MAPFDPTSTTDPLSALKSAERVAVEDVLRALLECEYRRQPAGEAQLGALGGLARVAGLRALAQAKEAGLAEETAQAWQLTEAGRVMAVRLMRAHRLTETKLARTTSLPAEEWHGHANQVEHVMSADEVDRLADALGHPRFDPHGDPIPTRDGNFPAPEGQALMSWPGGRPGVMSHIEDEPPVLFAKLAARGIFAGMRFVRVEPAGADAAGGCELVVEGSRETLDAELAALIRVRMPLFDEGETPAGACRLSDIVRGAAAEVLALLPGCIGAERSRLLDLGFVPGSRIEHELDSPLHGPAAYRVRGTLIALRKSQAAQVLVLPSAPMMEAKTQIS